VETVEAFLSRGDTLPELGPPDPNRSSLSPAASGLVWAIRLANRRVFQIAQAQQQMHGMGTTLVAARLLDGAVTICHVGDSRAYRFSQGTLTPVTTDHSLVAELLEREEITPEQARTFAERNIITRALGTRPSVAVDVNILPAVADDWYLLCSDGLCGVIEDEKIESLLRAGANDPEQTVKKLIAAANEAGGPDNITVAIAVTEDTESPPITSAISETVPESSDGAAEKEIACLDKLFPPNQSGTDSALEDTSTDRIPINLNSPPGPE
jgi:serine/threonine protein phosphatase PrpC